ncbi:MAG: hypothetical protein QOK43_3007 [Acidimicrobiaceae bacterium]|nr:hypothetical protein [Acidimicrobiaceae bacterium]
MAVGRRGELGGWHGDDRPSPRRVLRPVLDARRCICGRLARQAAELVLSASTAGVTGSVTAREAKGGSHNDSCPRKSRRSAAQWPWEVLVRTPRRPRCLHCALRIATRFSGRRSRPVTDSARPASHDAAGNYALAGCSGAGPCGPLRSKLLSRPERGTPGVYSMSSTLWLPTPDRARRRSGRRPSGGCAGAESPDGGAAEASGSVSAESGSTGPAGRPCPQRGTGHATCGPSSGRPGTARRSPRPSIAAR